MRIKWVKGKIKAGNLVYFEYNTKWREVVVFECPNDTGRKGKIKKKDGSTSKVGINGVSDNAILQVQGDQGQILTLYRPTGTSDADSSLSFDFQDNSGNQTTYATTAANP